MKFGLAMLSVAMMLPRGLGAQAADPATRQLIQELMARIDSLEKRVADLEKGPATVRAATPAPAPAAAAAAPGPGAVHATHEQPPLPEVTSPEAQPVYPALKIAGFSDFDFSATNLHSAATGFQPQSLLGTHSGFEEGQFVLQLSSALSPKVTVFSELSLTARSDAGTGTPTAPGFNPEVERIILRYDLNDYFKLSFGRYHTPINYWNTAFHHGQWLQTTISRPEMTQFGGSFIPVHFVGTLVEGATPFGGLNLNYNLGLGNGRGQVISRAGDFGDVNNARAWLANLFVKPDHPYGLQVGGSVYRDDINQLLTGLAAREWIESGHIVWQKENPEIIGEFANVRHNIRGSGISNSQAFYGQIAYRLPFLKAWKPYFRFEQIHVPKRDGIFRPVVPTFSSYTGGIRWDFASFAAFKLEYRDYTRRDLPVIRGIFTQTSFTF